ncbi:MAG: HDIG domain-containing protein [Treponema sp.]|jgi:putative nucleotidyltransferase with HDIG domain|nr:HDIG domain-containing protein [Treponema sp.]
MEKTSYLKKLRNSLSLPAVRTGPAVASAAAFIITVLTIVTLDQYNRVNFGGFEAGKVADRDITADRPVSYIDQEATRIRLEAQEHLVPAVFKYSVPVNQEMRKVYERFSLFSGELFSSEVSLETYKLRMQSEFPGLGSAENLEELYEDPDRSASLKQGFTALESFIETGVFSLSASALVQYNPDIVELLHNYGARLEREQIAFDKILTTERLPAAFFRYCQDMEFSPNFRNGAGGIVLAVLRENVFFSPEDTDLRLAEMRNRIEPVYRYIERGEKIIRKGFIVTTGEMEQLRALDTFLSRRDPRLITGQTLILFLAYVLVVVLLGKSFSGRKLSEPECYMMILLAAGYLIGAAAAKYLASPPENYPLSLLLPTALVVMLPGILIGFPAAVITALILPLGTFLADSFDVSAYIFALGSGLSAAFALQNAEKRMDLVKAGLFVAVVNALSALAILLLRQAQAADYPPVLFWAAFNGVASGMLVLGILPVIEQLLNAITPFRLIELSDLNSPILKRLFNAAPGTYSHSLMVANLAESACQDIGANALLARVGAYYHDIGKMDQSEYFVENQTNYNKHKDISPRLSATVIRNHVKVGIEKARALGLPEAIIAFIAEHHGNSLITWFYNEALKKEGQVNPVDFTYPGNPPRSRESAVVMLADVTEAAVRTLKKPTAARLEKYIQELFDAKVSGGQLSQSELTFRDLETIKNAFIKVLTGYYHSRIEYPKLPPEVLKAAEKIGRQDEKNGKPDRKNGGQAETSGERADREAGDPEGEADEENEEDAANGGMDGP